MGTLSIRLIPSSGAMPSSLLKDQCVTILVCTTRYRGTDFHFAIWFIAKGGIREEGHLMISSFGRSSCIHHRVPTTYM